MLCFVLVAESNAAEKRDASEKCDAIGRTTTREQCDIRLTLVQKVWGRLSVRRKLKLCRLSRAIGFRFSATEALRLLLRSIVVGNIHAPS